MGNEGYLVLPIKETLIKTFHTDNDFFIIFAVRLICLEQ